jgi:hypothetical protein
MQGTALIGFLMDAFHPERMHALGTLLDPLSLKLFFDAAENCFSTSFIAFKPTHASLPSPASLQDSLLMLIGKTCRLHAFKRSIVQSDTQYRKLLRLFESIYS